MLIVKIFIGLAIVEALSYTLVNHCRKHFPWFITPKDESPELSEKGLKKFMNHGFDSSLGWIRKPNTSKEEMGKWGKTTYSIDNRGSRTNPGHEHLETKISVYGDSFAFSRQVNDNETWAWHLSEELECNTLNFAVGNYGLDQALLRFRKEFQKNITPIVIMCVVPSTIVRILSLWKHYNEFGNTFAFKPAFRLKDKNLELIPNRITSLNKFLNYKKELSFYKQNDYFYKKQFRRDMIRFPYIFSILRNPWRNLRLIPLILYATHIEKEDIKQTQVYGTPMKIIMEINKKMRINLFQKNSNAVDLFIEIVKQFSQEAREAGSQPIFMLLPQKDDVLHIRKHEPFYDHAMEIIKSFVPTYDFTNYLITCNNLDTMYSDDNKYGGHLSNDGNKVLAKEIANFILHL